MSKDKSKKKKETKASSDQLKKTKNGEIDAANFNPTKGVKGKITVILMSILMIGGTLVSIGFLIYFMITRV